MNGRERASRCPEAEAARAFLERVRVRLVVSSLLGAAVFAALVNETVRWCSAAVVVYLGWKVPILGFLGLLVLAGLVPPTLRRWTLAAAAAQTDARLGLRDRMASWVDFRGRAAIPQPIRVAQALETARALAGTTPAAAAPIAPWRKAGPALLAACMLYPFFLPGNWSIRSPLVRVISRGWRLAPPGAEAPGGRSDGSLDGAATRPADKADPGATTAKPPADGEGTHGQSSQGGRPAPEQARRTVEDAKAKLPSGDSRPSGDRTRPARGSETADPRQPERIESERVGARLARVVEPLYRGGRAQATATVPVGAATFHLLPQAAGVNAGGGPGGEGAAPEPVRVDLDAVLAPYRPIVKSYFDQLARATVPARGSPDPAPTRSRP
jgi:hypothetical protein